MKVFIAADHRGIDVKEQLSQYLIGKGIDVEGNGLINMDGDDYVDHAIKLGEELKEHPNSLGVLICGNGIGMSIAANKVKGIRCARCVNSDDAYKARNHNGANVLAIGANIDLDTLKNIVDTFLNTPFATDERHVKRINKIIKYEEGTYNEL